MEVDISGGGGAGLTNQRLLLLQGLQLSAYLGAIPIIAPPNLVSKHATVGTKIKGSLTGNFSDLFEFGSVESAFRGLIESSPILRARYPDTLPEPLILLGLPEDILPSGIRPHVLYNVSKKTPPLSWGTADLLYQQLRALPQPTRDKPRLLVWKDVILFPIKLATADRSYGKSIQVWERDWRSYGIGPALAAVPCALGSSKANVSFSLRF